MNFVVNTDSCVMTQSLCFFGSNLIGNGHFLSGGLVWGTSPAEFQFSIFEIALKSGHISKKL